MKAPGLMGPFLLCDDFVCCTHTLAALGISPDRVGAPRRNDAEVLRWFCYIVRADGGSGGCALGSRGESRSGTRKTFRRICH